MNDAEMEANEFAAAFQILYNKRAHDYPNEGHELRMAYAEGVSDGWASANGKPND